MKRQWDYVPFKAMYVRRQPRRETDRGIGGYPRRLEEVHVHPRIHNQGLPVDGSSKLAVLRRRCEVNGRVERCVSFTCKKMGGPIIRLRIRQSERRMRLSDHVTGTRANEKRALHRPYKERRPATPIVPGEDRLQEPLGHLK